MHKCHSHCLTEPQSEEHLFHFFNDGQWQDVCGWCASCKWHSLNLILLFLLVGSTWRLLILFSIMVVAIWTFGNLLSILVPVMPTWKAHEVYASGQSQSHFCYQLSRWGTSSSISSNTSCTCRVLWPMVLFCCFEQLGNVLHHQCYLPCCLLLAKAPFLAKSPPSLLIMMARVSGSDKLYNSSLIYRIKWIMAMSWWLTLLESHCIQLNY